MAREVIVVGQVFDGEGARSRRRSPRAPDRPLVQRHQRVALIDRVVINYEIANLPADLKRRAGRNQEVVLDRDARGPSGGRRVVIAKNVESVFDITDNVLLEEHIFEN